MEDIKKKLDELEILLIIKFDPNFNYLHKRVEDIEDKTKEYNLEINKVLYSHEIYKEFRERYENLLNMFSKEK